MAVEIISWSISTKVRDWAGIALATPGSAVRHVTVCATWSGLQRYEHLSDKSMQTADPDQNAP